VSIVHHTLDKLIYSENHESGSFRLYIMEGGYHRGGISFRKTPRYPDEITAEAARKLVERAVLDNKEVRITNSSDFLVFHFQDGKQVYPATAAEFWAKVFA
jgi:hypothetical protein